MSARKTLPVAWGKPPESGADLSAFLREKGVSALPYLTALDRLTEGPASTQELIEASGLSRRGIEELMRAAFEYVSLGEAQAWSLRSTALPPHRGWFRKNTIPKVSNEQIIEFGDVLRRAPKPNRNLDHVAATAETVMARAQWLGKRFFVEGARVLFLGDHDLTALAVAKLYPEVELAVVDVDEALLDFLGSALSATGAAFRLRHADLRRRLPGDLEGWADLFVTDPPYTPEGVALFCARGAQSLRSLAYGRGLLAYGYGEEQLALGLAVQKAILGLDCVVEELIPDFNRYHGAQAIGSASDWHVLRFAPSATKKVERFVARAPQAIYSHGRQSVETASEPSVPQPFPAHSDSFRLASHSPGSPEKVVELRKHDPSALFRALVWESGPRLELLVDNNHPDLRSAAAQAQLVADVAGKWSLTFRKSTPDNVSAVVEAVAKTEPSPARFILTRPEGKLKNVLREARIHAQDGALTKPVLTKPVLTKPVLTKPVLTKNAAREFVGNVVAATTGWGQDLGECLVGDAPRTALRAVLAAFEEESSR